VNPRPLARRTRRPVARAWAALGVLTTLLVGARELAWALDCEGRLVSEGQAPWEVQAICGEPAQVDDTVEVILQPVSDPVGRVVDHLPVAIPKHVWTYNFGPSRLIYRLTFRAGKLVHIEPGGYGHSRHGGRTGGGGVMAIGWMWDYQVVERSGVPEPDEATLNSFGLIGYARVAVTPVAATGRLVAYLTRGTPPEEAAAAQA
jgi:Protein of unknown function (DUF2845)